MMDMITKNPTLKIISLILAITLWFFIKSKSGGEMTLVVPLELFHVPPTLMVTQVPEGAINVRMSGPLTQLEPTALTEVRARIDLSRARPGMNTFEILPDNVTIPRGLRITQIRPSSVTVKLDRVVDKVAHVKAVVRGRPASGYRLAAVVCAPAYITVQGAPSQVAGIKEVLTEEVDISGMRETVEIEVPLRLADLRLKEGVPGTVKVTVAVQKEPRSR
jgi:YbbR domain-containing protein